MPHGYVASRARALAKEQRSEPTQVEAMLWRDLRDRRLGLKFHRQFPMGRYVVDFVSLEARPIVELDGIVHALLGQAEHDRTRDAWLRAQGFRILRFSNDLILGGSGELVLNEIRRTLNEAPHPSSVVAARRHLLPQGEKGGRGFLLPAMGEGGAAKPGR